MKHLLILILIFIASPLLPFAQLIEKDLSQLDWTFHNSKDSLRHPAFVPGTIHTDLYKNKLIPDPFFSDNEKKLQWIENETWIYEASLPISGEELNHTQAELAFAGLDTYADVYVNDSLLLSANNMFREWNIPVKNKLTIGVNRIRIVFHPAAIIAKKEALKSTYTLPGGEAVFTRKSPFQFGWDWGPRFVTCGIWKKVMLRLWNDINIKSVQVTAQGVSEKARISFAIRLGNNSHSESAIRIRIKESGSSAYLKIPAGSDFLQTSVDISNPRLWWCRGLGRPDLYHADIELIQQNKTLEKKSMTFGIRDIKLVQNPDSAGSSFYFQINNKAVFAKGANLIPLNIFLPEVKKEDYEKIIEAAVDANMNMLRVWGGGSYEQDLFYDLCDKKGIMVWQDFMFACAMYPGDSGFINNVKAEVRDQVTRLWNHPCIALWCGNNEIEEGWNNWGWQKQYGYSRADSANIHEQYKAIFHKAIPGILTELDPSRPYHPSSPANGWGRKVSLLQGDLHYWGVWWGMENFEKYNEKVGRFVSEYGFQGIPDPEDFKKFIPADSMDYGTASFRNHQKHPTGFETISTYMGRDYRIPSTMKDYAYVSQLLQASGIKTAIEAHRRNRPYCMGSLYWQLNDCWPVVSWSSMDHYGNKKALHYTVKKAFAKFLISAEKKQEATIAWLVSDDTAARSGTWTREVIDFSGKVLQSESKRISIPGGSSLSVDTFKGLPRIWDSSRTLIHFSFHTERHGHANAIHYFKKPAGLLLKNPGITLKITGVDSDSLGGIIRISAEKYLAMGLRLSGEDMEFSDNYFDILPGESKMVRVRFKKDNLSLKDIQVRSLFDTIK